MPKQAWPYRICLGILLLGLLVLPWTATASETSMEGYREIAAFELKQLLDSDRKVLIINVLSKIEYDFQHISGSINIPIVQMLTSDRLPPDKHTILVFHCLSDR
ncbi:MAG: rhodanese-like domain-containing protein [Proteobacteria bacterium]|nr:rhodanese-like domain-containing protein [Pseudomonadota bacterium]MBU4294592.1 rhodanese-like domain-containing protein [Pseudomonadota bacterium]MCG2747128.1 rhodanese-like domain-containing protein [Desulfobulbaceae bacterium]